MFAIAPEIKSGQEGSRDHPEFLPAIYAHILPHAA
jgi:hypothetical protein